MSDLDLIAHELIGAGPTSHEPAEVESTDPGEVFKFGPSFVRFVTERFAAVELQMAKALELAARRPVEGWRFHASAVTDGTGAIAKGKLVIYECPPGMKFALHRLYVHAQGYSWAVPFTGAASELTLRVNDEPWTGYTMVSGTGQLPAYFSAGRLQAVEVQDGERLTLQMIAGPANTVVECRAQGVLSKLYGNLG